MKKIASIFGIILFFVAIIIFYNLYFSFIYGDPKVLKLESKWWAGYYDTQNFGKQWCVARFAKSSSGNLKMALISSFGLPDVFRVEKNTSNNSFVYLTFTSEGMRIEAKQLYTGKRYIVQRLLVGRFKDFWKKNEDIAIRGHFYGSKDRIEIEPLNDTKLLIFWKTYVRPKESEITPNQLLAEIGFMKNSK